MEEQNNPNIERENCYVDKQDISLGDEEAKVIGGSIDNLIVSKKEKFSNIDFGSIEAIGFYNKYEMHDWFAETEEYLAILQRPYINRDVGFSPLNPKNSGNPGLVGLMTYNTLLLKREFYLEVFFDMRPLFRFGKGTLKKRYNIGSHGKANREIFQDQLVIPIYQNNPDYSKLIEFLKQREK